MDLATLSIGTIENLLSPLPTASPNGWHWILANRVAGVRDSSARRGTSGMVGRSL